MLSMLSSFAQVCSLLWICLVPYWLISFNRFISALLFMRHSFSASFSHFFCCLALLTQNLYCYTFLPHLYWSYILHSYSALLSSVLIIFLSDICAHSHSLLLCSPPLLLRSLWCIADTKTHPPYLMLSLHPFVHILLSCPPV